MTRQSPTRRLLQLEYKIRNDDGLPFGEEGFDVVGGNLDCFGLTGDHHGGDLANDTYDSAIESTIPAS